ncbi:MAG: DNA internalization-related competence protein ComEC/Rec2 [Bacillus sp. (in: Bacteria)]|nr:DNA internalization-related competence protein ComEC/Rec2 [Bacillus sp. (in: firmicutes)]
MVCSESNGGFIYSIREKGIEKLMESNHRETSAIMAALVYGERSFLTEERINNYRQLGVLHLLAVSGLHVGMVTFAFYYVLIRLGITREKANIMLMVMLPFYIMIAGGAPSVVRASLLCFAALLMQTLKMPVRGINLLTFICLAYLLYDPFILFHLGFQLSFLTSYALLLSNKLFREQNKILLLLKVTFVAQLITLPIIIFHFYEFSILAIPINLLFIPFISLWILPLSFFTVILASISPKLSTPIFLLSEKSLSFAHYFLDKVAAMSWDMLVFGKPSTLILLVMMVFIIVLFVSLEWKSRRLISVSMVLLCFAFAFQLLHPYFQREATITVLDVGQGDAIVIELPRRKAVYLIDTGGVVRWNEDERENREFSGPGRRVIEPYLKGKGIGTIDRMILTHGHTDHVGEACFLLDTFAVKKVMYPLSPQVSTEGRAALSCAEENGVPIVWTSEGDRWTDAANIFYVMNPTGFEVKENDLSIVLLAVIEDVVFLFTGDIEEAAENRLISHYPAFELGVLKIAHHGSRTSTSQAFLEHFEPMVTVVSAGRNNRFGHPHGEVLDRLEENGIPLLRTDKHGAVMFHVQDGVIDVRVHWSQ